MFGRRFRDVRDIVTNQLCMGCGLCESLAGRQHIRLTEDAQGFLRPRLVGEPGAGWHEIRQSCPGIILRPARAPRAHPVWGRVLESHAGHAADEQLRWKASSGGALSALLCSLLESGQADAVIQTGAARESPLRNTTYITRTPREVCDCAGSRYAPSSPLREIIQVLQSEAGKVALVGKPCDVAGLRQFLRLRPEFVAKVSCMLSFACAGVPSYRATDELVRSMGLEPEDVQDFWYRGRGWPGRATATAKTGRPVSLSYNEAWNNFLGQRISFRCAICPDGMGNFADIVCADPWRTKNGSPVFDEQPGESLILVRTERGRRFLRQACNEGKLVTKAFDLRTLRHVQPYQYGKRAYFLARRLALATRGYVSHPKMWRFAHAAPWQEGPKYVVRFFRHYRKTLSRICRV